MTNPVITTVTGPVARDGWPDVCLTHVHLLGGPVEAPAGGAGTVGDADLHLRRPDLALAELQLVRQAGCGAVVEMSVLDFNRDLAGLRELSQRSGVAIIAATGFRRGGTAAAAGVPDDWSYIADLLRADVFEGRDGVLVGVLKAGGGRGELSSHDRSTLRAAAVVQQESGLPISTHSDAGELALEQVRELERWGADLRRVAVGHVDRRHDISTHAALFATGVSVIYDQIGKDKYAGVQDYARLLAWVGESGYAHQLMISSDFGRQSYLTAFGGHPGLAYVPGEFRREVVAAGVEETLLSTALGENVWRFYSHPAGDPRDLNVTGKEI